MGGGGSVPPVLMTGSGALPPSREVKTPSAGVLGAASRKARVPAVTAAVTSICRQVFAAVKLGTAATIVPAAGAFPYVIEPWFQFVVVVQTRKPFAAAVC